MVAGSKSLYLLSAVNNDPSFFTGTHLSVLIDRSEVAWAVTERRSGKVVEVGSYMRRVELSADDAKLRDDALHQRRYGSGSIAFRGNATLIIPKAGFQADQRQAWLRYGLGHEVAHPLQDDLRELDAVVLTVVSDDDRRLADSIPAGKLVSNAGLYIGAMLRHTQKVKQPVGYVDIANGFFDLYLRDERGFLLHNTFEASTPEDVIYHTANAVQQLKLDLERLQVRLSGNIGVESETYKLYRSYFGDVSIHFGFGMPLVDLPLSSLRKQEYMSLLNQYACVS
jgi:hypothetical protein